MRLSTLLELAQYYKNKQASLKQINESASIKGKPIFEAYAASLIHKWDYLFRDNFATSSVFFREFEIDTRKSLSIESVIKGCSISFSDINNYINDKVYKDLNYARDLSDSEILKIIDNVNQFDPDYFVKYSCNHDCTNEYFNGLCTENNYRDMLRHTNAYSLAEYLNLSITTKGFKISEVKNDDLVEITPKQARSKIYKDSLIFWEDTKGRLMMVSEGPNIRMSILYDGWKYNKRQLTLYLIKNVNDTDSIPPFNIDNLINNSARAILNYIAMYIRDNYCVKFSPSVILNLDSIKDEYGTVSTTLYTDDGKRLGAGLPDIGKIYAVKPEKFADYTHTAEYELRIENNRYYNLELPQQIEERKRNLAKIISKCKSLKEFSSKVDTIDNLIDYSFDMLLLLNEYIKIHINDPWFKTLYRDTYACFDRTWMGICQNIRTRISNIIDLCENTLQKIAEFKKYDIFKIAKETNYKLEQHISSVLASLNGIRYDLRELSNDKYKNQVFQYMKDTDPQLVGNLIWKWGTYNL